MAQSFSINSKISQKQKLKFRNFHALSNNPKTNREKDISIQSSIDEHVTYGPIINEAHTTKNASSYLPFEQVRKTAPHHSRFQTLGGDRFDLQRNSQSHQSERMQSANTCHKASERRYDLEKDSQFQKDMYDCINILQRMPGYKNKVWEKISNMHS